jgi:hypothetical protein
MASFREKWVGIRKTMGSIREKWGCSDSTMGSIREKWVGSRTTMGSIREKWLRSDSPSESRTFKPPTILIFRVGRPRETHFLEFATGMPSSVGALMIAESAGLCNRVGLPSTLGPK